jgi:hypothetical protein
LNSNGGNIVVGLEPGKSAAFRIGFLDLSDPVFQA